ncbi:MAG: SMC-Scp complex subunit ScpB [Bdellovibrionales bacterium RIFCSPHIGHO2_01_FULL_40_29]|nr:MAG: SMC-Scp complex subunit ScpB [Bdellovibrionales bacterium RIFCSPHIGHO2_01_FULL_40_29]OFZ35604.1 MAG: SMC-Scp complex subunit ScpB [Bdellovibrionales bacterium RIFCSPHIGHO2_02_FULL_40_15]
MARKKNKTSDADGAIESVKTALQDIEIEASIFMSEEVVSESFLPEVEVDEQDEESLPVVEAADLEGSELDGFEAADIEELEFVEEEQIHSIIESILFASDRPVSFASIQQVFKGTNVKREKIRRVLESLAVSYAGGDRGIVLEEITGGYQLRTKVDNMNFLKRTMKTRAFKLSGPALETLSIVAYKQPVVKIEVDQIRGVESGHLLRALMEKGLVSFEGKAEHLPGKPMQYGTTRRFLEIFGLRNLKELPTLSQIDELLPEGIGDETEEKQTLSMVTESMAENSKAMTYSEGEEELGQIEEQLTAISTSSEFFEQEKIRQKMKRDEEKAQNIREALAVGEAVSKRDINWLKKFENPEPIHPAEANAETNTEVAELNLADATVSEMEEAEDDELPMYEEADDEKPTEEGYV